MQVVDTNNSVSKSLTKGINLVFGLGLLTVLLLSFALVNWIAANWSHMNPDTRLILVQSVFMAAVLIAFIACWRYKNLADFTIQFAALVIGALLALIGQIYQTGADSWYLFAAWAILITPWLILLRTIFITITWALLFNITVFLYTTSSPIIMLWLTDGNLYLILINLIFLCASLLFRDYLHDNWGILNKVFASAIAVFLFLNLLQLQFSENITRLIINYAAAFLLLGIAYYWFTQKIRDLFIVSMIFVSAIAFTSLIIFQLADDIFGILILSLFVILASVIASKHLLKLLQYNKPESGKLITPWHFYWLRISALLLAAGLFLTWLLLGFEFSNRSQLSLLSLIIMLIGLVITKIYERKFTNERTNIIYESALVAIFAGLGLFTVICLLESNHLYDAQLWQLLALGLVIYFTLNNLISRFLSALLILAICIWYIGIVPYILHGQALYLWSIKASYFLSLFAALAFYIHSQPDKYNYLRPFAVALFVCSALLAISIDLINTVPVWQWSLSALLAALSLSFMLCLFVSARYRLKQYYLPIFLLFLFASIAMLGAFTLLLGLCLLAYAVNYRLRVLAAMAVVLLIMGMPLYYFQTSTSLSFKALQFGLISLSMFLATLLIYKTENSNIAGNIYLRVSKKYLITLIIGFILVIGFTQYQLKNYQNILNNGTQIILKLAPVDPRSIMQGDYMQLNYELRTTANSLLDKGQYDSIKIKQNNRYWLILKKDNDGIWNLYAITDNLSEAQELLFKNPEMVFLSAKLRDDSLDWGANTWFFAEGTAVVYEQAKYGVLRVNQHGTALLEGLLDADLHALK